MEAQSQGPKVERLWKPVTENAEIRFKSIDPASVNSQSRVYYFRPVIEAFRKGKPDENRGRKANRFKVSIH